MKNILALFIKYHGFMLFLLLQTIAISLVVSYNNYHQSKVVSSSSTLVGNFYEKKNNVTKYLDLDLINNQLAEENAKLRELNREYKRLITTFENDSSFNELNTLATNYIYTPAKVINSSINRPTNSITLNKGTFLGIKKDMAVIGPQGIIGVTTNVSKHFASVLPVINQRFTASVKVKDSNYFGLLKWNGKDWQLSQIDDIAKHAIITKGDTIVTRGGSAIFPENVLIGTVDTSYVTPGSNYHHIEVKLSTDFSNISHVYVIENTYKQEQKQIELSAND